MTQLFIRSSKDAQWIEAALPAGFKFKLTVDNTYFTRSGEYSGEIELPLSGCPENVRIFGHINRLDVRRRGVVLDARLVVDNSPMVVGSVTVLECNEQSVKVQLLGGNASVNFQNRYNNTYIDQMDLGTVFDGLDIGTTYKQGDERVEHNVTDFLSFRQYLAICAARHNAVTREDCRYGTAQNGFVLHPAVDEDGNEVNLKVAIYWRTDTHPTSEKWSSNRLCVYPGMVAHFRWTGAPPTCDISYISRFWGALDNENKPYTLKYKLCPQPYVDTVVRRVIAALGYNVIEDAIADSWFSRCYFPSTTETIQINEMLPHWIVTDFLTELESFFGVIFYFDDSRKECRIMPKRDYFTFRAAAHLLEVDDQFETTFDEDNMVDVSNSNVSFGVDDDIHHLSDDIQDNVIIEDYGSYSIPEMEASLMAETTIFGHSPKQVLAERVGRHYVLFGGKVVECDELRDFVMNDASDEKITLKIRPAKLATTEIRVIDEDYSSAVALVVRNNDNNEKYPRLYPSPVSPAFGAYVNDFDIEDAIINGVQKSQKADYLPVAMDSDYILHEWRCKAYSYGIDDHYSWRASWGYTYGAEDVSDMDLGEPDNCLRLNDTIGMVTLYHQAINIGLRIVGQTLTKVKIYDHRIPSLDRFFIFDGKKYCCQKIEYTVTNEGIEREKDGYFYTVDES